MEAPRNKKWVDGKQGYLWPVDQHVGWMVQTAGQVDLDLFPVSEYNKGSRRLLPRGYKVHLKHIDEKGMAYVYDPDNGTMKMPQELLEPVGK